MKGSRFPSQGAKAGLLLFCALAGQSPALASGPVQDRAAEAGEMLADLDALKAADVAPLSPDEAMDANRIGQRIRWAGAVYGISPSEQGTCLTILYARSGDDAEPRWAPDPTYQAFVACTAGGYAPLLVHENTNVTIVGTISGKRHIGMGGGGSEGPLVEIGQLYRWSDCIAGDMDPVCRQGFVAPEPVADVPAAG